MKNQGSYMDSVHRLGRIGSLGAIAFMIGIPMIISYYYNIWPNFGDVFLVSLGLLALFVPLAISEVISFMPILGSASYITYITGNVMNLKIPVALNAAEISGTTQGTEESDVITTMAIAVSSIVTMIIISIGVLLLVPLSPLFTLPVVQTATTYMLPALFGGMFLPMLLNKKAGEYTVKWKLLPTLLPLILVIVVNSFIFPLKGFEGLTMLVVIPTTILMARVLYKKKIIKMKLDTPAEDKAE